MKFFIKALLLNICLISAGYAQQEIPSPWVAVSPLITAGAYTSGMAVGGTQQITSAVCGGYKTGYLTAITDADFDNQLGTMDIWLFDTAPSGTYNDHAVVTMSQSDLNKSIGHVHLDSSTDVATLNGNGELHKGSLAESVRATSGINLYFIAVIKQSVTYTHTNAHQFKFSFACDMKVAH
jgi:hypothetical protein